MGGLKFAPTMESDMSEKKVILITGATTGIGFDAARFFAEKGHRVFGTGRKPEEGGWGFEMLTLDVTSDESVAVCFDEVKKQAGRLDVLINNAGVGLRGAIEETTPEDTLGLFDVNLAGPLRCCRAALPLMREGGGGTIINIGSIVGLVAVPWSGMYSASKFALEGLTQALRMEVVQFGVRVFMVNPGRTLSKFAESAQLSSSMPEYKSLREAAKKSIAESDDWAPEADIVTEALDEIIDGDFDEHNYIVGEDSAKLLDGWNSLEPEEFAAKMADAFGLKYPKE